MPSHYPGTTQEILALDTYIKLSRAASSLDSRLFSGLPEGLTESQFAVLEVLLHLGTQTQTELGRKILKSNANITLVLDNLEKRGYVQRTSVSGDRRIHNVNLTESGAALIRSYFPQHLERLLALFAILTIEEQQTLSALLKKLGRQGIS